jgi:hypothetical protein
LPVAVSHTTTGRSSSVPATADPSGEIASDRELVAPNDPLQQTSVAVFVAGDHNSPMPPQLSRAFGEESVAMSEKTPQQQVSQADVDFAVDLLDKGETVKSVLGNLVKRGVKPEVAWAVLKDEFEQAMYDDAIALLNQGYSPEQVKILLVGTRLEKTVTASV